MDNQEFKHSLPLQIRFNDVDKFGHINNTVYFSFYDLGKTEYFTSVCPNVNWERDAIMVVHIEVDFLDQIFSTDQVAVETTVTSIGNKSFNLLQRLIDTRTNKEKCICRSTMVTYDLVNHTSKIMNPEWVESICAFEGKELRKK